MSEEMILPQSDHDLIVAMVATSKVSQSAVLERIADIKIDIAELKGNYSAQYSDVNSRLKIMEALALATNPTEQIKKIEKHEIFINDYISTHKERNAVYAFWFSIIGIIISAGGLIAKFYVK